MYYETVTVQTVPPCLYQPQMCKDPTPERLAQTLEDFITHHPSCKHFLIAPQDNPNHDGVLVKQCHNGSYRVSYWPNPPNPDELQSVSELFLDEMSQHVLRVLARNNRPNMS